MSHDDTDRDGLASGRADGDMETDMTGKRSPVVNLEDVLASPDLVDRNGPRGPFEARIGMVGRALGTRDLGVNVTVVPPGKRAWPRHYHYANDEMFVVLSGTGTLRYGDEEHPIRSGDVVSILAGTGIPFQIVNSGEENLRYLAISTLKHPDVFVYPDSGKIGFVAGGGPMREAPDGRDKLVRFVAADHRLGYWEGETES